jgi:hypothetical protein
MLDDIIKSARVLNHKSVLLSGLAWRGILHFFQTEYEIAEGVEEENQRSLFFNSPVVKNVLEKI